MTPYLLEERTVYVPLMKIKEILTEYLESLLPHVKKEDAKKEECERVYLECIKTEIPDFLAKSVSKDEDSYDDIFKSISEIFQEDEFIKSFEFVLGAMALSGSKKQGFMVNAKYYSVQGHTVPLITLKAFHYEASEIIEDMPMIESDFQDYISSPFAKEFSLGRRFWYSSCTTKENEKE